MDDTNAQLPIGRQVSRPGHFAFPVVFQSATPDVLARADKRCRAASAHVASQTEKDQAKTKRKDDNQTTMDLI
jgi:hypothetical protein